MILTCPNCATRFFVEPGEIGPAGREVQCDACGRRWTVEGDAPLRSPIAAEPATPSTRLFVAPPAPARRPTARPRRRALIGLIIVLVLLVASLVAFRGALVEAWPGAAGLYRIVGLPARA